MAEIKEHPILFNAESVKAILEGRKSQTRRVMRPQPVLENGVWRWKPRKGWDVNVAHINPSMSPYGTFGDHLWVKETWDARFTYLGTASAYAKQTPRAFRTQDRCLDMCYRATCTHPNPENHVWMPSIFMPRWASRITLEVLDGRVERTYDITLDGLIAEGCPTECLPENCNGMEHAAFGWFVHLWNGINQKRGFDWNTNCWVWCVSFRRLD